MPGMVQAEQGGISAHAHVHALVRDLHNPDPRIYWTDLLLTAVISWSAFAGSLFFRAWSGAMFAALLVCVCAAYRGLCFLHEITHLRGGVLRRFELVWNLLFGVPMLLPSFMYVGVHQHHHNLATYGTDRDPEYLPFFGKRMIIVVFVLQSLLIPLMLLIRFFVLFPASLVAPSAHRRICARFSALCLNVKFRREISDGVESIIRRWETIAVLSWLGIGALAVWNHMALRTLATWYAALACVALVNTIRTLGAHRYSSDGTPLDRDEQLIDSIDTPGAVWTELWAPVGLRYHALHHYFPGIPYHNLGKAYRRLANALPADALYHHAWSPGLHHSLHTLYTGQNPARTGTEANL